MHQITHLPQYFWLIIPSSICYYCIKFWHYWPSKLLPNWTLLLLHFHHILALVASKFLTKWTYLVYDMLLHIASHYGTTYPQNSCQNKRFCYIVTLRSQPAFRELKECFSFWYLSNISLFFQKSSEQLSTAMPVRNGTLTK